MNCISFEIEPALHQAVRAAAAARGITTRQFMAEALVEHPRREANRWDTESVFNLSLPAPQRDWDNERDAVYDELG